MKKSLLYCLLIICAFASNISAESTWTKIGLAGGNITDMESFPSNPDIMLACVAGHGIYRSTDRGDYWTQIIPDACYDISISEDDVAFIAGEAGVQVSHDFGATWTVVDDVPASQVISYRDGVVASNTGGSLWNLSHDNGETWEQWAGTEYTTSLLFHEDGCVYRNARRDIYRSDPDDWSIWTLLPINDNPKYMLPDLNFSFSVGDSVIFAYSRYIDQHPMGYQPGGVYSSNDRGLSWVRYTDDNFNSVTVLMRYDNTLFIGGNIRTDTSYKLMLKPSISQETTVIGTFSGQITAIDAHRFNSGEILVATQAGIFKTTDSGINWDKCDNGIMHTQVNSVQITTLETNTERILVSTKEDGVYYSDDNGEQWISADLEVRTIPGQLIVSPEPQRIYAAEASIYMSDDYGESWELIPSLPVAYYGWYGRTVDIDIDPQNSNRIVINYYSHSMDDYRGIFTIIGEYTDSEENTWEWSNPLDVFDGRSSFRSQFSSDFLLWISKDYYFQPTQPLLVAIDEMGELVRTISIPDNEWSSIWNIDGQYCYALNRDENRLLISSDFGETWRVTELLLEDYISYDDWAAKSPLGDIILSPDRSTIFLLYPGNGIIASTDNGETWGHFDDGIGTTNVYQMAFSPSDPTVMYAATENGLYRCESPVVINDVISFVEEVTEPAAYPVIANYPNPFNPATTITYTLPEPGMVTLSVYSVTGQKVATLADQPMTAGTHAVQFDGTDLASGVYFARLEAGNTVETRKMLLVK